MKTNWQYNPLTGVDKTMSTPKHTPTPWLVIPYQNMTGYKITNDKLGLNTICEIDNRLLGIQDASHIVKCVNMHDELVKEIHRLQEFIMINHADPKQAQGRKAIALLNESSDLLNRAKGEG